jgi:Mor family transcriptional regulator
MNVKTRNRRMYWEHKRDGKSLSELGRQYGVTKQRVHQIVQSEEYNLSREREKEEKSKSEIDPLVMKWFILGEINLWGLIQRSQLGYNVVLDIIERIDCRLINNSNLDKSTRTEIFMKYLNDKFMEGATIKELSEMYQLNSTGLRDKLHRFRKENQYPNKYKSRKETYKKILETRTGTRLAPNTIKKYIVEARKYKDD